MTRVDPSLSRSTTRGRAPRARSPFALCRRAFFLVALLTATAVAQAPFFNRNVPQACHAQMASLRSAGHTILCVAFPPAGGDRWTIVTDRGFVNRNVPQECHTRMVAMHNAGHRIICVAYPPAGGNRWSIVSDRGFFNRNVPQECHSRMVAFQQAGHRVLCVAYPPAGGNSWSVVTDRSFFNRNVPSACHSQMVAFRQAGQTPRWVAYPAAGGNRWSILTDRSLYNRNVASEAHQVMVNYLNSPGAVQYVAFTPAGNGFSIVGRIPDLEISSATSTLANVTASTLSVVGENFDLVTAVDFGRSRITRTDPGDPTQAYFERVSSTRLRVHPPQGMGAGNYTMRLASAQAQSDPVTVRLTIPSQPRILTPPSVVAGASFAAQVSAGPTGAGQTWLAFSPSTRPSVLRGVVSLGIGDAFRQLVVLDAALPVSSFSSAARFVLPSVPSLAGHRLHFQALLFGQTLPLDVTDVDSTLFR